ncbi:MAG: sulfite exporter TauE/SafE family protein [Caulobacterales bacterium]|nr:sulfite exporter TauE/SafE family protein [Caulobacterales bacterium]
MLSDPWFYAVAVPGILLVGVSKGGFGGSVGLLGLPLLALALPATTAVAIMLPILCVMDLVALRSFRGGQDWSALRELAPAAVLGIAIGAATFRFLDADSLRQLIGAVTVLFALHQIARELRGAVEPRPARPGTGWFWGGTSGFTSFVAHAGGPPLIIHMLALRLEKTRHQATTVMFFAIVNYVKLVPYTALGLFDRGTLAASAALAPFAPLGIWLGVYLHRRVNERWFYRIATAGLLAAGVRLLWP